ncbi:MAG: MFS transporter, partial [Nocardioides sp.]
MELTTEATAARTFWTYWSASATSSVGSAVGAVALPLTALLVLDATPVEMGLIAASAYAAWLVIGLPAGVIAQRLPLRRLQVGMDLVRALAVASIPLAWWLDRLTLTHLVVTALITSFANVLFDVANSTFLPSVVPREQLQARNSLMSGTHAASQLGGPSLGGVFVQLLGAVPTLLLNSLSYLASAVLLGRLPERTAPTTDRPPMRELIREGWHYVTRHPVMGPC